MAFTDLRLIAAEVRKSVEPSLSAPTPMKSKRR